MGFAVFALTLLIDVAVIDHLVFVGWHWINVGEQIMPLLCFALFGGAIQDVTDTDVLLNDRGLVFLPPFPGVRLVEPGVVRWHEMPPLQELQRFLLRVGATRDDNTGTDAGCQGDGTCHMEKLPS